MLEKVILLLGIILIIYVGAYLWLRPAAVAEKLKSFSSTYPLIRLAGEKQHTARTGFVKFLGVVFAILGITMLLGVGFKILK
jgi:hypothetical protein